MINLFQRQNWGSLLVAASLLVAQQTPILAAADEHSDDSRRHAEIKHVFVIVLENEGYDVTFGATSKAPYLSKTLTSQGVLLSQYYGTGHASLDNYIAMISGQAATPDTRNDCQVYADFNLTGMTPDGQAIGSGCVYPASIKTLPDQLSAAGKTWRAYAEDMGNDPSRESASCGHPTLNTKDLTQSAQKAAGMVPADQYAARHNPFVYFHSIIDSSTCNSNVVNLSGFANDLQSEATTPDFVFITPNLCNDGHDGPCVTGAPGGLVSADAFLQKWIPTIMNSPAYKKDGLIIINFDEGGLAAVPNPSGSGYLISAPGATCCSEQPGPNLASFPQSSTIGPYTLTYQSFGGDRTGAVLLSPFLKGGTVSQTPFNHYSLLKSLEEIYGVEGRLGYAGQAGLVSFFGCETSDIKVHAEGQFAHCEMF